MTRSTRAAALVLFGTLAASIAGCGTSSGPEAVDDPRPTTTATSQPAEDPPGKDQIVWQEVSGGGFTSTEFALGEAPDVTIYADGRILVTELDPDGNPTRPAALREAQVPDDELDHFLTDAADSGLFDPGADFGEPGITDQATTSVSLRDGGALQTVDVYALGFDTGDPEGPGGVDEQQAARRADLQQLLSRARALGERATPYTPDRVRATLITLEPDSGTRAQAWPGPPLSTFPEPEDGTTTSCLVIEGGDAEAVTLAAVDNPEGTWSISGTTRQIVTAPLVPGQEGCPPA